MVHETQHPFLTCFASWRPWHERDNNVDIHYPGIYALAISKESLAGQSFSFLREIVYFGMTNAVSGLRGRLKQFDNTIQGGGGHGGAERFCHDFPKSNQLEHILYVSVMPIKCSVASQNPTDLRTMGRITRAEYECFAHYVELYGQLPKYNDKKNAPKRSRSEQ